ncbi:DNA polymerase III subunit delta [Soehngenia longivitae]|uniref:DNA polymerase III subunit delta n=1 Tax=Soehngenia longivitae TaxID=2562294 RepID=A0A4Z0D2S7_9FIRM|nr:DNA polymerase III subunit delta [Soehngenia longivitae]TFZ40041.1 DNA polymerase III subunit delta [Soehngenia longivitae]
MNYNEFKLAIKKNNFKEKYIFIGEEVYLMEEALEKIIKANIPKGTEGMNLTKIDFKDANIEDLRDSIVTLPFLAQRKITVVYSPEVLIENYSNDIYMDLLSDLGDHQVLILIDNGRKIKTNSKLIKFFKSDEIILFEKLKGKDLVAWIEEKLKAFNKKIDSKNLSYFIQQSGYLSKNLELTLNDLENEILKVVAYSEKEIIDRNTIDNSMIKLLDKNIFDLLTSIGEQNVDSSLKIFSAIYLMDEPVIKIIYMINRQLRLQLAYKSYKKANYSDEDIIAKLEIKPYEYNKISAISNRYTINRLTKSIQTVIETEKTLKSKATNEKYELENLIVRLVSANYK